MEQHILIIEDDPTLNAGIAFALEKEGFAVHSAHSLLEAERRLDRKMNLILLDVNLPDGDGRDFLRHILAGQPVPVICLTALDTEEEMLKGFRAGCDDYVTKPFSMPVLVMKMKALLKRCEGTSRQIYCSGELVYDFDNKTLKKHDSAVELTALEVRLLEYFIRNRGIVLTRENLLDKIWDARERYVEEKTLNVNIRRLRKKIEDNPEEPRYIRTVFGIGYKWEDD